MLEQLYATTKDLKTQFEASQQVSFCHFVEGY